MPLTSVPRASAHGAHGLLFAMSNAGKNVTVTVTHKALQNISTPLLRIAEVCKSTGCGRTVIYELMRDGKFPPAVKLPGGGSRWWEHEVEAWKAALPRATRRPAG